MNPQHPPAQVAVSREVTADRRLRGPWLLVTWAAWVAAVALTPEVEQ